MAPLRDRRGKTCVCGSPAVYGNGRCRACARRDRKLYEQRHPERAAAKRRRQKMRMRYGLESHEADALLAENGGRCRICDEETATHIDHDHATGSVRGGLCKRCNHGLGSFRDRPDLLAQAIAYLRPWRP